MRRAAMKMRMRRSVLFMVSPDGRRNGREREG